MHETHASRHLGKALPNVAYVCSMSAVFDVCCAAWGGRHHTAVVLANGESWSFGLNSQVGGTWILVACCEPSICQLALTACVPLATFPCGQRRDNINSLYLELHLLTWPVLQIHSGTHMHYGIAAAFPKCRVGVGVIQWPCGPSGVGSWLCQQGRTIASSVGRAVGPLGWS